MNGHFRSLVWKYSKQIPFIYKKNEENHAKNQEINSDVNSFKSNPFHIQSSSKSDPTSEESLVYIQRHDVDPIKILNIDSKSTSSLSIDNSVGSNLLKKSEPDDNYESKKKSDNINNLINEKKNVEINTPNTQLMIVKNDKKKELIQSISKEEKNNLSSPLISSPFTKMSSVTNSAKAFSSILKYSRGRKKKTDESISESVIIDTVVHYLQNTIDYSELSIWKEPDEYKNYTLYHIVIDDTKISSARMKSIWKAAKEYYNKYHSGFNDCPFDFNGAQEGYCIPIIVTEYTFACVMFKSDLIKKLISTVADNVFGESSTESVKSNYYRIKSLAYKLLD